MPTAAINQFWLSGWGPPNSLVPGNVDLIGLKDPGVVLVGLKDRPPALVGSSLSSVVKIGLKDPGASKVGLKDDPSLDFTVGS